MADLNSGGKSLTVTIADLSAAMREFYEPKGELCVAIKLPQRSAKTTFRRQRIEAARYNLNNLYARDKEGKDKGGFGGKPGFAGATKEPR